MHLLNDSRIILAQNEPVCAYVGASFKDPLDSLTRWTVTHMLTPISGRRLGGRPVLFYRARLVDQRGVGAYINQRDLELLVGAAKTGSHCELTGGYYPGINDIDDGWVGICTDSLDEVDELYIREMSLRAMPQYGGWLYPNILCTWQVRVVSEEHAPRTRYWLSGYDYMPETWQTANPIGPDTRFSSVEKRWRPLSVEEASRCQPTLTMTLTL